MTSFLGSLAFSLLIVAHVLAVMAVQQMHRNERRAQDDRRATDPEITRIQNIWLFGG